MKSSVRYMAGDIQLLQTHWIVDAFSVRFVTWQETSIVAFERIRQQMKNEVRGGWNFVQDRRLQPSLSEASRQELQTVKKNSPS